MRLALQAIKYYYEFVFPDDSFRERRDMPRVKTAPVILTLHSGKQSAHFWRGDLSYISAARHREPVRLRLSRLTKDTSATSVGDAAVRRV